MEMRRNGGETEDLPWVASSLAVETDGVSGRADK